MPNDLATHLRAGAHKLRALRLAFASDGGDYKFDAAYWEKSGRRSKGSDVLTLVPGTLPSAAVAAIFAYPSRWQFDCSQFVQVVNYYAWLKVLGAGEFDRRVAASGRGMAIRPFVGSVFTARRHYYRRESRAEWMKYFPNGDQTRPGLPACMTAWEIVNAAPIGSRVNFANSRAQDPSWNYENTVKVSRNEFIAHGLGGGHGNVYRANALIREVYREGADRPHASLDEANRYVWIKEVEYFVDVPTPTACQRR
jgi:hypothetical protein